MIWSTLGPKTMELVQENITAIGIYGDVDVLEADADLIEQFINDKKKSEKAAKRIEINLDAIIKGRIDDSHQNTSLDGNHYKYYRGGLVSPR